jgi:hypothetical protein
VPTLQQSGMCQIDLHSRSGTTELEALDVRFGVNSVDFGMSG